MACMVRYPNSDSADCPSEEVLQVIAIRKLDPVNAAGSMLTLSLAHSASGGFRPSSVKPDPIGARSPRRLLELVVEGADWKEG